MSSTPGRLRVAMVGLGDIAQKAYLPVLATRRDVELRLVTRNAETLARLGSEYPGAARRTTPLHELDDVLDEGLDAALVHAATDAHHDLVERLLSAGVPVLVDKPLAPRLEEATRLVELAERRGVSLMVGFNRRFAPALAALAGLDPTVVLMQKNRVALPGEPRRFVLDDFIHVVDTLRFLMPDPPDGAVEEVSAWCSVEADRLRTVTLALRAGDCTALGVMHRTSGTDEEVVEVLGAGWKHRVVDLVDVQHSEASRGNGTFTPLRDGWAPVGTVRGFADMCDSFLASVRSGEVLSARDALRTHEICEQVVVAAGSGMA